MTLAIRLYIHQYAQESNPSLSIIWHVETSPRQISITVMTKVSPRLPSPPLHGRCQCAVDPVEFTVSEQPHSLNICYCHECQRQSGSAYALTLVVPSSGLHISSRSFIHLRRFERTTESGGIRGGVFCGRCGNRLWHFDPSKPEWTSIKAGTLDEKVDISSAQHIWTKRMLNGMELPEGAEAYEEEPSDGPV